MNAVRRAAGRAAIAVALVAVGGMFAASHAAPVCKAGFQTIEKKSWLLKCSKTVPVVQKGVTLTQAQTANCKTDPYWNFGPKVDAATAGGKVTVVYTCGHVEG